jgi:hypothetical protein
MRKIDITIGRAKNKQPLTAVWQNGGFSAKLNIQFSKKV